jgi:hypothetical protein
MNSQSVIEETKALATTAIAMWPQGIWLEGLYHMSGIAGRAAVGVVVSY